MKPRIHSGSIKFSRAISHVKILKFYKVSGTESEQNFVAVNISRQFIPVPTVGATQTFIGFHGGEHKSTNIPYSKQCPVLYVATVHGVINLHVLV